MASGLYHEGNALFVDEDYEGAKQKYTEAIELNASDAEYFVKRAACNEKLREHEQSLVDADAALALQSDHQKAMLRRGIALFGLERFRDAKKQFQSVAESAVVRRWLAAVEEELEDEADQVEQNDNDDNEQKEKEEKTKEEETKEEKKEEEKKEKKAVVYRREWFQSPSHVTVDLFIRGRSDDQVNVTVGDGGESVELNVALDDGSAYTMPLSLAGKVEPSAVKASALRTKIELRMKKAAVERWQTLEREGDGATTEWFAGDVNAPPPSHYPTSHPKKVDWDKLEVEEEKLSGDAALNKVFQDIFARGSDEQRRAMVKSFTESGGTVLSTNWDDVGARKVEGSPPEGMEQVKF
jgi:suppressor of G2 allele of SKP1